MRCTNSNSVLESPEGMLLGLLRLAKNNRLDPFRDSMISEPTHP